MDNATDSGDRTLGCQRARLVRHVAAVLDTPTTVPAFVWLVLLVLDLTRGLSGWLAGLSNMIRGVFAVRFLLEWFIAPRKWDYLRRNWLTVVALVLPALRVFLAFRVLRLGRATRRTGLIRVVTSANRGAGAIRAQGFGYVVALTVVVSFARAAGMFAFESPAALSEEGADGPGLHSYGEAVWWTATALTTMGADYFPKTPEGRLLGWLLVVYAFAIFGYITAMIATFFVGPAVGAGGRPGRTGRPTGRGRRVAGADRDRGCATVTSSSATG